MKPRVKLATAQTPDGGEMTLYQHDQDFLIRVNGHELMHSRQHESELELARLGCAHLVGRKSPHVLIGGLGMGYTLRQTLDMLSRFAQVTVCELLPDVITWNRTFLADLNKQPLEDARTEVKSCDVVELIAKSTNTYDAILLDIDNGPSAISDAGNAQLYSQEGMEACRDALSERGCLAVWSGEPSKEFERLLMRCHFHVRRYRVPSYKGSKSLNRFVWVASEDPSLLPPGGGEPIKKRKRVSKGRGSHFSRRSR